MILQNTDKIRLRRIDVLMGREKKEGDVKRGKGKEMHIELMCEGGGDEDFMIYHKQNVFYCLFTICKHKYYKKRRYTRRNIFYSLK